MPLFLPGPGPLVLPPYESAVPAVVDTSLPAPIRMVTWAARFDRGTRVRRQPRSFFIQTPIANPPAIVLPSKIVMVTGAAQFRRYRRPSSRLWKPETVFPTPDQQTVKVLLAAENRRSQRRKTTSWLGSYLGQLPGPEQQKIQTLLYKTDLRRRHRPFTVLFPPAVVNPFVPPAAITDDQQRLRMLLVKTDVRRRQPGVVLYPPVVVNPFVVPPTDDQQHIRVMLVRRPKPKQYTTVLRKPVVVNPPAMFPFQQQVKVIDYAALYARMERRRRGPHSVLYGPATLVGPVASTAKYRLMMGVGV